MVENEDKPTRPTDTGAINGKIKNGKVKVAGRKVKGKPSKSTTAANGGAAHLKGVEAEERKLAKKPEKPTFPAEGMINAYGFIHLNNDVAEAFDAPKGRKTEITIDLKDGKLVISKA